MAQKSHPGAAERYWNGELDLARKRAASAEGWLGRIVGLLGFGTHWCAETEAELNWWCWSVERLKARTFEDGDGI